MCTGVTKKCDGRTDAVAGIQKLQAPFVALKAP